MNVEQKLVSGANHWIHVATKELAIWLETALPKSNDWWNECVLSKLNECERQNAINCGYNSLYDFDLIALVRIAQGNIYIAKDYPAWCSKMKDCLNHLYQIRVDWAHLNAKAPNKNKTVQDLTAMLELFELLNCDSKIISEIKQDIKEIKQGTFNGVSSICNAQFTGGAEEECRIFWNIFKDELQKNGNPFYFTSKKHWAVINRQTAGFNKPMLSMDFSIKKKILRINVYLPDNIELFNKLLDNKSEIEARLGFSPMWAHGEKGKDTYRIKVELPFIPYDRNDYCKLISSSIPIVQKYIYTFEPYIQC